MYTKEINEKTKEDNEKEVRVLSIGNVTLTPHMAGGSNDAFTNSPVKLAKRMLTEGAI